MGYFKRLVIESAKKIDSSRLTDETWGNLSVRDSKTGYIFLTPSGMKYSDLTEDDIVVCDAFGRIIEGKRKPTVEMWLHITIYQNRPDVNAVIHTHPVYSLVYAAQGRDIPIILDEAAQTLGGTVRCAKYALPGSTALAKNCLEALGENTNACLLTCHGAVCVGGDMDEAFMVAAVLETTARVLNLIECSGGRPLSVSADNLEKLQEIIKDYKK
ncbi:MAG: class II aldolase/adducin family protein [Candidatus Metalachnospira sp.]|nr:class II aldolase/adducin family protein [Candidatus Metalachnospira sp.]